MNAAADFNVYVTFDKIVGIYLRDTRRSKFEICVTSSKTSFTFNRPPSIIVRIKRV